MTVAVAVAKNGRIVLAADSLVHFGGQRFTAENARFHKIHRIGDSLLAWAGWSLYAELLTAHLVAHPPHHELTTEARVFDFFIEFWRAIRDDYTYLNRPGPDPRSPFAELDSVFLLANRHGIFSVAGDMDVTQFRQYCAVGSGSKYALGALRILYDNQKDPARIARRAVEVGIECDVHCGGRVDLGEVRVA
jgi:ATP-dependent protease HslVU (ClpYQ) peptidase subunit